MEIHNQLQSIVSSMIQLNKLRQEQLGLDHGLSDIQYAYYYKTVSYNPGRQCGKSMLIARNADKNDIVITYNHESAKKMQERLNFFNRTSHPIVLNVNNMNPEKSIGRYFNIIWVDEPSVLPDTDKYKIYEQFARRCDQFVFLG